MGKINSCRPANNQLQFVADEEYLHVVNDLLEYFRNSPTSTLDISKGIYLAGNVGTRKSSLLEIFSYAKFPGYEISIRQNQCQLITEKFIKDGFDGIHIFVRNTWRGVYDDLGVEPIGKHFGNVLMVMSYVIQQQYKNYLESGYKPFFTSNLDLDEVDSIYGMREGSRVGEMCNVVYLGGSKEAKDWRRF